MKFGLRTPSLRGRIAARTSWKRFARHSLGLKAPRGMGWLTNPKRAAYNRMYNRTTLDAVGLLTRRSGAGSNSISAGIVVAIVIALVIWLLS
jgi:hypothetical protein